MVFHEVDDSKGNVGISREGDGFGTGCGDGDGGATTDPGADLLKCLRGDSGECHLEAFSAGVGFGFYTWNATVGVSSGTLNEDGGGSGRRRRWIIVG